MNKKEIEKLFEQELGINRDIHIELLEEPYEGLCLEPFKDAGYQDWIKDGSFDLKRIKVRVKNKESLIAAIDLILFSEEDIKELGFEKAALYLDCMSGSLSHITKLILDEDYQRSCCNYVGEAEHYLPFSGELRTLYIAKTYRKRKLGKFLLDNLNKLLEYEFRVRICSLVVYLHPFMKDVYMGGYTDYENIEDRVMLKNMESFYTSCFFTKYTEEKDLYIRRYNVSITHD